MLPLKRAIMIAALLASLPHSTAAAQPGGSSNCSGPDTALRSTDPRVHVEAARGRTAAALGAETIGRIDGLFRCLSNETHQRLAFTMLSGIVPKYFSNASCFEGDVGVLEPTREAHEGFARQYPERILNNLKWKIAAAENCLESDALLRFHGEVSVAIANVWSLVPQR
jgi:hypothetical protein